MKRHILTIASALMLMPASIFAQGFSSPLSTEKKPWTAVPQIKSDDYKFVVIPDKKGGDETGVFDVAVQEINRLAPDFVINIGDLIEGYVSDVSYTVPMWDDILGRLEKLEAPFFLVGGNHDLSSEALTEDFIKRFGTTYYSFNIGPDLFLVLDSEEHGGRDISDAQVKYFEKILKGWNGRHIYVFMHSPNWYPTPHGGYEFIDKMLQGHQFTVFSGHTHTYYMEERGGMEYYVVATAGGDSELRGAEVGEFDHYMLVSAREGKPAIANIPIGAMVPNDVVNKDNAAKVRWMLSDGYFQTPYLILNTAAAQYFSFDLTAFNPMDSKMEYSFDFPEDLGLSFAPASGSGSLEPGEKKTFHIDVTNTGGIEVGRIPFNASCGFELMNGFKSVPKLMSVFTDCVRTIEEDEQINIDVHDPYKVSESWDWSGVEDGWFEFSVSRGWNYIQVAVTTHDDIRASDKVYVTFESAGKRQEFEMEPEEATVRIPLKEVKGGEFFLNVRFRDNDDVREADPSVLWWRDPAHMGKFVLGR